MINQLIGGLEMFRDGKMVESAMHPAKFVYNVHFIAHSSIKGLPTRLSMGFLSFSFLPKFCKHGKSAAESTQGTNRTHKFVMACIRPSKRKSTNVKMKMIGLCALRLVWATFSCEPCQTRWVMAHCGECLPICVQVVCRCSLIKSLASSSSLSSSSSSPSWSLFSPHHYHHHHQHQHFPEVIERHKQDLPINNHPPLGVAGVGKRAAKMVRKHRGCAPTGQHQGDDS